jgi:HSP20 family protein
MNLMRFDPFRELEEMNARLGRMFGPGLLRRGAETDGEMFGDWLPPMDVQETDKEFILKADLPDVKKDDVRVAIEDGILTVEGERRQEKEEKGKKFHRIERAYGKFVRKLAVPVEVDAGNVAADFKDGVLVVRLPKSQAAKPKTIDVRVN